LIHKFDINKIFPEEPGTRKREYLERTIVLTHAYATIREAGEA